MRKYLENEGKEGINKRLDVVIKWLVALGFITLPSTHIKWVLDLVTTRPVSLFFFAAAVGLVMLRGVVANRGNPKGFFQWKRAWENWSMLR